MAILFLTNIEHVIVDEWSQFESPESEQHQSVETIVDSQIV